MTITHKDQASDAEASDAEILPYEEILAHGIKDVVAELCLTDASILVSWVCGNLHGNIEDLVDSSTELFFKEGTLRYGHGADVNFEWGKSPAVLLDMEFIHPTVSVFFKLVLHGIYVGVSIHRILFNETTGNPEADANRFAEAVADARLVPIPPARSS